VKRKEFSYLNAVMDKNLATLPPPSPPTLKQINKQQQQKHHVAFAAIHFEIIMPPLMVH
jgi:hypothetical protein